MEDAIKVLGHGVRKNVNPWKHLQIILIVKALAYVKRVNPCNHLQIIYIKKGFLDLWPARHPSLAPILLFRRRQSAQRPRRPGQVRRLPLQEESVEGQEVQCQVQRGVQVQRSSSGGQPGMTTLKGLKKKPLNFFDQIKFNC